MPRPDPDRLLPVVLAYLPVAGAGAVLSAAWNVGASPDGDAGDMVLRGTALTPPLFLPIALLTGAVAARRGGRTRRAGAGVVALVGVAFLAGSTANLPNDLAAAEAAGTPRALTGVLAIIHLALAITLLFHAVPTLLGRRRSSDAAV
ncbi:MAG TPA: hypothetical protein VLA76_03810 [Candidatus Angelobacter sp.]|nr:hypothetical protein [Candidatus Angelobacter sp.]